MRGSRYQTRWSFPRLNESPRPKAGKYHEEFAHDARAHVASMKVPTRMWGNLSQRAATLAVGVASMKVSTCRWRNLAETDKASKGHYPHLYYQSAIELVIPPLLCRTSLANEQHAATE